MTHNLLPLSRKKILITSGSTRAYLDAVRYISNISTGRLGREIATEALRQGASVTLLYGTGSSIPLVGAGFKPAPTNAINHLTLIEVETVNDLLTTLQRKLKNTHFDAIIHAMAVLDYVPERYIEGKVPSSGEDEWIVKLVKTPKGINIIRDLWSEAFLVGFKLEVGKTKDELLQIARNFQVQCKANLIVANRLEDINNDRHTAYFVNNKGELTGVFHNKKAIAEGLMKTLIS
ncbi:MAG TPA: phosphopantothenoylcysteine decarboxylase domain-containing protein [Candidatus Brocadiia bacterium]|nr:phosphopantothenoylcysteine decarboxylase [Candidatus Brocadiales bacterium]